MRITTLLCPLAGSILLGACLGAYAQTNEASSKYRFGLSYRMGFNVSAKFRNLGTRTFANTPSVNGVAYEDGFVGTDSIGNAGNLTTRWGYANANQAQAGNADLVLHSSRPGTIFNDVSDDPIHGFEFSFARELGGGPKVRWGLEAAFNWSDLQFRDSGTPPLGTLRADRFELGYPPPSAPYVGPVTAGPGIPLLGTVPTAVPVTSAASFEAGLYGFRLGPYLDVPLSQRVHLTLGVGMAFVVVDGELKYRETYGSTAVSAASSDRDVLFGGYASAQLAVSLSKHLGLFTGLQYQGTDEYKQRAGNKEVSVDFSGALYWVTGLNYKF